MVRSRTMAVSRVEPSVRDATGISAKEADDDAVNRTEMSTVGSSALTLPTACGFVV